MCSFIDQISFGVNNFKKYKLLRTDRSLNTTDRYLNTLNKV